jgi:hypothetical protein
MHLDPTDKITSQIIIISIFVDENMLVIFPNRFDCSFIFVVVVQHKAA